MPPDNTTSASTPLLPARQLNEFVYCPRLFYFQFVQGIFVHNADTIEGKYAHQRVDGGKGELPTEAGADEVVHSRSVALASDKLGVTAKLDVVELEGAGDGQAPEVSPVEYKKGSPREGEGGGEIWPADKMQLGLQMLLLRENGYRCTTGYLYYRGTRQRIPLELTDADEAWISEQIAAARYATTGPLPPPLDHSPRCPRCSHVGHCLPDETRYLVEAMHHGATPAGFDRPEAQLELPLLISGGEVDRISPGPFAQWPEIKLRPIQPGNDVRRLLTPTDDTRALYLQSPHLYVSKKGETLIVKEKDKVEGEFRLIDLHHLALFGNIQLSSPALQALCEKDIPITYFTLGGWFYGMTRGHSLTNVFTRIEQFRHAADPELRLQHARLFVHGKVRNQRTLLMRNHSHIPKTILQRMRYAAQAALGAGTLAELMGIEGAGALAYFSHFQGMLKPPGYEDVLEGRKPAHHASGGDATNTSSTVSSIFRFSDRNRRPPRDPVNALLSLGYSLLARDCTLAAYAAGFDPYVGFLHQPRYGRPALALDIMEEFRPIVVDSVVLTLINNGRLRESDFTKAGESISLSSNGRRTFFLAYEQRMATTVNHPVFDYKLSYRRAIELQFRLLARVLTGEIEQYVPFTTR